MLPFFVKAEMSLTILTLFFNRLHIPAQQLSIANNLKKELIRPTKIYTKEILKLANKNLIKGCANITGGGISDNLIRILPSNISAEINLKNIKCIVSLVKLLWLILCKII